MYEGCIESSREMRMSKTRCRMRRAAREKGSQERESRLDVLGEVALRRRSLVVRSLRAEFEALRLVALLLVADGRAAVGSPACRAPGRNTAREGDEVSFRVLQGDTRLRAGSREVKLVDLNERKTW